MTTTTTARYQRTHGKSPRGKGTWAFKRSTTRDAYDADGDGPSTFAPYGTRVGDQGDQGTEEKVARWHHFEDHYDGGIYDLGDLRSDTDEGDPVVLRRAGEWAETDADAGAEILRTLGYEATVALSEAAPETSESLRLWTITVRRAS